MNAKTNLLMFMAIIALTTATQGQLSERERGQAVSEFNAVKTSLEGQLTDGEQAQRNLEEAEGALERNQEACSELILEKTLQGQQVQGQQSEDFREFVRELEANYERQQAKLEQEQAALSELRRVNTMMEKMTERFNNTTASDPRETMKICQEMLPKLDDSFRVYMQYATNYGDADQRIEVQRRYVATRQQLLDIFNLAQRQLAQPEASPTPSPGSVSRVDVRAPNPSDTGEQEERLARKPASR